MAKIGWFHRWDQRCLREAVTFLGLNNTQQLGLSLNLLLGFVRGPQQPALNLHQQPVVRAGPLPGRGRLSLWRIGESSPAG